MPQPPARRPLAGALLAVALALATMPAAQANPFETTLANGMKVIVKEDRRAPSAVHMVWYRSGSMDEEDGVSGVAHVLEHMMFKGTKTLAPGEFNRRVAAVGGRDNAFTGKDYEALRIAALARSANFSKFLRNLAARSPAARS